MATRFRQWQIASWLLGLAGLGFVAWYFQPGNLGEVLGDLGIPRIAGWLLLTLVSRAFLVQITVMPIRALGFHLRWWDAFWIGWIRTFSNLFLPMSGLALYVHEIRRRARLSWSELAALSSPQFLLAACALGLLGTIATSMNLETLQGAGPVILLVFVMLFGGSLAAAAGAAWFIESLPEVVATRIQRIANSFRLVSQQPRLLAHLVSCHCAVIIFRGGRLWILFAAAGVSLDLREALLLVTIAESSMLLHITPGGLGIREGAVVGGAALLGISPEAAAGIALIDRFFEVSVTTFFAVPAIAVIRAEALPERRG